MSLFPHNKQGFQQGCGKHLHHAHTFNNTLINVFNLQIQELRQFSMNLWQVCA